MLMSLKRTTFWAQSTRAILYNKCIYQDDTVHGTACLTPYPLLPLLVREPSLNEACFIHCTISSFQAKLAMYYPDEAIELFRRVIKLDPTNKDARTYYNITKKEIAEYRVKEKKIYGELNSCLRIDYVVLNSSCLLST